MPAVPASLRIANQATILEQLLERKAASRAELAKATGMSKPTAGKIIDDLVHAGVVEELKIVDGGRPSVGRPGKQLRLATNRARFVVMELGVEWTRISGLPPSPPEHERWEVQFKTPASDEAWQERVAQSAEHQGPADTVGDVDEHEVVAVGAGAELAQRQRAHLLDQADGGRPDLA